MSGNVDSVSDKSERLLEVCVDNLDSAIKAALCGAKRLEICSSLSEGGLTPSYGLVSSIKKHISKSSQIHVMIRCKSGSDFCYDDYDMEIMLTDIQKFKELVIDGFVFGALNNDGTINTSQCNKIVSAAYPLPITFHRAFDVCTSSPINSLDILLKLGFNRLLTSGKQQCVCSDDACAVIKQLLSSSDGKITIMAGSGINEANVEKILKTGVSEIHASCLSKLNNENSENILNMGKSNNVDKYYFDEKKCKKIISVLKNW